MVRSSASRGVVEGLRRICLGFPEAVEKSFGGHVAPSFRVRDKLFVVIGEDGQTMTCKAPPGIQAMLVASDPDVFFVPPYVGSKGWVGVRLDSGVGLDELAELAEESYRLIAGKRLSSQLTGGEQPAPS